MLTQQAINRSSEIEAINQQLLLTAERQDYAEARQWTNYLTLDPVRVVQNVLGGGDVQRDRIAIAGLELETANLIRRREEVAEDITSDVVDLVLSHNVFIRRGELAYTRLVTQQQREAAQEAKYRTGQSNTDSMLRTWQRTEELTARCEENRISHLRTIQDLYVLVGENPSIHSTSVNDGSCIWHNWHSMDTTFTVGGEQ
mgnify:CR=1 FL=1